MADHFAPFTRGPYSLRCNSEYEAWLEVKGQSASWDPDVIGYLPLEIQRREYAVGVTWGVEFTVQHQFEAWKTRIGTQDTPHAPTYKQREVVRLPLEFRSYIKEHQREALRFMWKCIFTPGEGGCLLAHGMGLGKTVDVIALLATYVTTFKENSGAAKVLYEVPKNVMVSLKAELRKFSTTFCEYQETDSALHPLVAGAVPVSRPQGQKKRGRPPAAGTSDSLPSTVASSTAEDINANKDKIRYYNFSKDIASSVTKAYTMIKTWNLLGGVLLLPDRQDVVEAFGRLAYAFGNDGVTSEIKEGHAVKIKGHTELYIASSVKSKNASLSTTAYESNKKKMGADEDGGEEELEEGDPTVSKTAKKNSTALSECERVVEEQHMFQPGLLLVDEAHEKAPNTILGRNFKTRESVLKSLQGDTHIDKKMREIIFFATHKRVMMTGTPIQNGVGDLWDMMHIVRGREGIPSPHSIAPDRASFMRKFQNKTTRGRARHERQKAINAVLQYYFLEPFANVKNQQQILEYDLPPRSEYLIRVRMNSAQKTALRKLFRTPAKGGVMDETTSRKILIHPDMNTTGADLDMMQSPKMVVALALIRACVLGGHKVVFMSENQTPMDVLSAALVKFCIGGVTWEKNKNFIIINGKDKEVVKEREKYLDDLNTEETLIKVAFISKQIGYAGITLNPFSRMILFDFHYKPSTDTQCMARIYRYGQTRPVFIYRLVAFDTIEESKYHLQEEKNRITTQILYNKVFPTIDTENEEADVKIGFKPPVQDNVSFDNRDQASEQLSLADDVLQMAFKGPTAMERDNVTALQGATEMHRAFGPCVQSVELQQQSVVTQSKVSITAHQAHQYEIYLDNAYKALPTSKKDLLEWRCHVCCNLITYTPLEDSGVVDDSEDGPAQKAANGHNGKKGKNGRKKIGQRGPVSQVFESKFIACRTCHSVSHMTNTSVWLFKKGCSQTPVDTEHMGVSCNFRKRKFVFDTRAYKCACDKCEGIVYVIDTSTGLVILDKLIKCVFHQHLMPKRRHELAPMKTHTNFVLHCLSCKAYVIFEGESVESRNCVRCHARIHPGTSTDPNTSKDPSTSTDPNISADPITSEDPNTSAGPSQSTGLHSRTSSSGEEF